MPSALVLIMFQQNASIQEVLRSISSACMCVENDGCPAESKVDLLLGVQGRPTKVANLYFWQNTTTPPTLSFDLLTRNAHTLFDRACLTGAPASIRLSRPQCLLYGLKVGYKMKYIGVDAERFALPAPTMRRHLPGGPDSAIHAAELKKTHWSDVHTHSGLLGEDIVPVIYLYTAHRVH